MELELDLTKWNWVESELTNWNWVELELTKWNWHHLWSWWFGVYTGTSEKLGYTSQVAPG